MPIGHAGLVAKTAGNWVHTIEGNTNMGGSRTTDGVYRRLRHNRTVAVYANWLSPVQKGGNR